MPGVLRRIVRSPGAPIAALGALLCLSTIALFLTDLQTRYWDRIASAKADARSFANILAEHTALTFDDVDRALVRAEAIRKTSLSEKLPDIALANTALRQVQKSSSILVAIGWTDASGEVIAHSDDKALPRNNISGMSHFIAQRDNAGDALFIAPPYRLAVSDKWFTAASRRLSNLDGSFAGIVTAPIDQAYFTKLYRSINLGSNGSVLLLHRDGQLLAREPALEAAIGRSYASAPLLAEHLPKSESGSYETLSVVDGVPRIAGYKAVSGLPLVVLVSFGRSDVLAPWYRHLYTFGLLVSAITVVILFGTIVLVRQTNSLAAKSRALVGANARFAAALANMPHGLSMFDRQKRLVTWNARYAEIYGLPPALLKVGTHLNVVAENLVARGILKGEPSQAAIADKIAAMDRIPTDAYGSRVEEFSDGRLIRISRQPMEEGGWVATHEDITEERQAERRLAENATELRRANERFDVAISNMSQGLCLFDLDKRLVISNKPYQEMYGLPDELVMPGTPLSRILQHYADRGETSNLTVDQHVQLMPEESKQDYEPADGRQILIQRKPLPDGGWVATHEDFTEQKLGERLLAEKAAELEAMNVRFNAALNNMSQGLCMFDAEQRVVVSNARYGDIYHLGRDQIKPGTSLTQILEHRREKGTDFAGVEPQTYLKRNVRETNEIRELADGRVVAIARHIMANGGWLTTHDDITARARSEKRIGVFQPELTEAADLQKSMENELREAIARNEFEVHYQPVIEARTGAVSAVEAFVRWDHPSKGMLPPDQFLSLAESTGLMAPLGEWILQKACLDAVTWPSHVRLAVNISAAQFTKGNLFDTILCALVESGLPPDRLELEIADTALLERHQGAHLLMIRQLRNLGVSIVLDSCRAGYSAASYLTSFPFDKIKIDKSIAQGIASRRDCGAAVASVLALARGLDIATTAKGVESHHQYEALLAAGVDFAQGYLFGRPVPHAELDFKAVVLLTKNVA